MPWTYSQNQRTLTDPDGHPAGTGYSGRLDGYNNHDAQAEQDIGPVPAGSYDIGAPFVHRVAGPVTMRLTPQPGTNDFGRDGFMIHGDSADHAANPTPENSVSHGCIILARPIREAIAASEDKVIVVTA